MIIKCEKCGNSFLAPDDLEEGRVLKCGKCQNEWELKQEHEDIPETIKPSPVNHTSDFNKIENPNHSYKIIFMSIAFIAFLAIAVFSIMNNLNDIPSMKKLKFQNLSAVKNDTSTILTGQLINTSNQTAKVPDIIIQGKMVLKPKIETINPGEIMPFNVNLPANTISPIKVTF